MENVTQENNVVVEKTTEQNPLVTFGEFLMRFINQSKIVRDYTVSEMIELAEKLKTEMDRIDSVNPEDITSYGKYKALEEALDNEQKHTTLLRNLPYELIVRICSLYDTFLANLLKGVLYDKSLVGLFEKNLTLKEIERFDTKEELIKYCVDFKIDELFRKSHQEQIEWIEKSFDIQIRNSFNKWKQIILFFEMRNIIVHNNGIVNRTFLENLEKARIKEHFDLNQIILVTPSMLRSNIENLFVFAIYTFSLLLGKLYKKAEERDNIDGYVIQSMYELLIEKQYETVIRIADHCLQKNQVHSNSDWLMITINKCIALKYSKNESYREIIDKIDWSNCNDEFLLAKYTLLENYTEACKYIQKLGNDEENIISYVEWPLYDLLRETQDFHMTFKKVFGVEFEEKLSQIAEEKSSAFKQSSEELVIADGQDYNKIAS